MAKQWRIWGIVRRAIVPTLVLALGIASLVYGVRRHTAHVFEEQEIEIALAPPVMEGPGFAGPGGPPGFEGPPGLGGPPGFMSPFGAPPPELQKVKKKIYVGKDEPEMAVVREVTIGGLMRLDTGELQRTYSGAPPTLCPT